MGSFLNAMKTLFVPALISLTVYLLLSYVIVPFVRHYRERYAQYLPLHTISAHTSTLCERASDAVMRCVLRISSRHRRLEGQDSDEEGEEMSVTNVSRRQQSDGNGYADPGGRLSRELEQGFMDDSD
ncbi:hypothetical protein VTO42DRAFT_622 [Malbranchea cinnamomea]